MENENLSKTDIHKRAMIEALKKSLGIASAACNKVGISRETHYEWMRTDENYKAQVLDVKEVALDFTEGKMFEAIANGDSGLIKYHLSTQGKHRGYVEKVVNEHTGKDGAPIETENKHVVEFRNMGSGKSVLGTQYE